MRKKTKGIITAGHPQTAESALRIMAEGGNAFDAAVAALFTSFCTESCMSSAGGGAFANIYTAHKKSMVFDFFCQTPSGKRPLEGIDFYPITVDFGGTTEDFHIGMGSIGVPGTIAGIYAIYDHLCTLPMRILVEPAIEICKNGAYIDDFQFFDFKVLKDILKVDEQSLEIYFKNDELVQEGQHIHMKLLADFLESLSIEGQDLFYKGEISKKIAEDCQEKGGFLTRSDLENYRVNISEPLSFTYRQKTILTNPMPSMGGSLLAIGLKNMELSPVGFDPDTPGHAYLFHDVLREMDLQDKSPTGLANELLRWGIKDTGVAQSDFQKRGSTTHLNILDELGNAISITTSNGEGSGYMVPGTQIMMNNMLGEAALLPHGFHNWKLDVRLSSMMSPTLVLDQNKRIEYVLGTGGASRIPRAILQVLYYLIDLEMDVDKAVHAPRAHFEHKLFNMEPGFSIDLDKNSVDASINHWDDFSMFFGGVHTIARRLGGFEACGDLRRSGVVVESV